MATAVPKELEPVVATILGEARGEGYKGMAAVARAIVNRANVRGQTLPETVSSTTQFNGNKYDGSQLPQELQDQAAHALHRAMSGYDDANIGAADHFLNPKTSTSGSWTKAFDRTATVGSHEFYASPQAARSIEPGKTAIPTAKPEAPAPSLRQRAVQVADLSPVIPESMLHQPIQADPQRTIKGYTYDRSAYDVNRTRPEVAAGASRAFQAAGMEPLVNSSFREGTQPGPKVPSYNKVVGGASASQHKDGNALDLSVTDLDAAGRAKLTDALMAEGFSGFGFGHNIIHADMRPTQATWTYGNYSVPSEITSVMSARSFSPGSPKDAIDRYMPEFAPVPSPQAKPDPNAPSIEDIQHAEEFQSAGAAAAELTGTELIQSAADSIQLDDSFNIVPAEAVQPAPAAEAIQSRNVPVAQPGAAAQAISPATPQYQNITPVAARPMSPVDQNMTPITPSAERTIDPASPRMSTPTATPSTPASMSPAPAVTPMASPRTASISPTQPAVSPSTSTPRQLDAVNSPHETLFGKDVVTRPDTIAPTAPETPSAPAMSDLTDTPEVERIREVARTMDLTNVTATPTAKPSFDASKENPQFTLPGVDDTPQAPATQSPQVTALPTASPMGIDSPLSVGPRAKPEPPKVDRPFARNIGRGVGAVAGGAAAGPFGAIVGAWLGGRVGQAVPGAKMPGTGFGNMFSNGYANTPTGRAVAAATQNGGFDNAAYSRTYAQSGGGQDGRSYSRHLAEEQNQRAAAGQKTWADAFGF